MPLIEDEGSSVANLEQLSFHDRLRAGLVVPIISDRGDPRPR